LVPFLEIPLPLVNSLLSFSHFLLQVLLF
jgi:hypothetical protein